MDLVVLMIGVCAIPSEDLSNGTALVMVGFHITVSHQ